MPLTALDLHPRKIVIIRLDDVARIKQKGRSMKILMKQEFLETIKGHLLMEQERLIQLLAKTRLHIHRSEPISADFAEQSVEVENDVVVESLDQNAQIELSQVNKALKRMKEGTFGSCVVCNQSISVKRLEAIPHTPFCIKCASAK